MAARKSAAATASDRRFAQAVEAFEKAVKALGKHDYPKAADLLDQLVETYPDERELLDRARSYREACRSAMAKKSSVKPKGTAELIHQGIFLHNQGEFDAAVKLLEQAVSEDPRSEDALYCLAATAAQAGHSERALEALRLAIEIGPGNRAQARSDGDFDPIRDSEEFIDLVYTQG